MKKINKSVKFLLALSLFLSTGSTLVVNATHITDPSGIGGQTAPIPVHSRIGAFDPTDPDSGNPIGPDGPEIDHPTWLSISVPTIVMFSSGGANGTGTDHDVLGSPDFTITNHSARGVYVTVNGFAQTGGGDEGIAPIETLTLVPAGAYTNENVDLFIDDEIVEFNTALPFMTIANATRPEGETTGSATPVPATFNFSGTATNTPATAVTPTFSLVLGFRVNSMGYTPAPPTP